MRKCKVPTAMESCEDCMVKIELIDELLREIEGLKNSLIIRTEQAHKLRRQVADLGKRLQANDPINPQRCN